MRGFDPAAFRQARTDASLSITDLARLARIGRRTVQGWESGVSSPQVDVLARVCTTLGIEISDVVRLSSDATYPADLRILAGLTQPELGARTGISTSTVGAVERAEVELSAHVSAALADGVGAAEAVYRDAYERARRRPAGEPA